MPEAILLAADIMISIGFHVSIAGSVANAPAFAAERGYGCFQIFVSNSRAWAAKRIPERDALSFKRITEEKSLTAFAHIPYLCNLASANSAVYRKSRAMLLDNIKNCMELGVRDLVIHLGSHLGKGAKYGIENICEALAFALDRSASVNVLLENSSGYRNSVGSNFNEIGNIIDTMGGSRLGVCFDTCHAFAAGYDMGSERDVEYIEEEFESQIGLQHLRLIHLNDAKYEVGSGRDRHWHIGEGYIGRKGFTNLFKSGMFNHGFFILETPGGAGDSDARNLKEVKRLLAGAAGRAPEGV